MIYFILLCSAIFTLAYVVYQIIDKESVEGSFSTNDGDMWFEWKVDTLIRATEGLETVNWTIPYDFLEDWCWGDEDIYDHIKRCLDADLRYPIIVDDRGIILDGCHRAIKTLALGRYEIKAKVIAHMPKPDREWKIERSGKKKKREIRNRDMVLIVKALMKTEGNLV